MGDLFRDREHLVRMVGLLAVGLLVFVALRGIFIPKGYGDYGPFRAGALADNQNLPLRFAGRAACEDCHDDVAAQRASSRHAAISCEACHGPLQLHVEDPSAVVPELPAAMPLCLLCHQANVTRPHWFPQVDPVEHAQGEPCQECHPPHHPET